MGGGLSPALPVLIQIPVFLSAVKSVLYNFNFLQGLIPWSVIAQTPNPPTQPLQKDCSLSQLSRSERGPVWLLVPFLYLAGVLQLAGISSTALPSCQA